MQLLLKELKIDSVVALETGKHDVIAFSSPRLAKVTLDVYDIRPRTIFEQRIETTKSIPLKQISCPFPFQERRS